MTDNIQAKDALGNAFTLRSKDLSGGGDGSLQGAMSIPVDATGAPMGSAANPLIATAALFSASAIFNRPADTTAYGSGDLVANSTSVGSVTPLQYSLASANGRLVRVTRALMTKTSTTVTNAIFRLHLYRLTPASIANGDNDPWVTAQGGYAGSITFDMSGASGRVFSDGVRCVALPDIGDIITIPDTTSQIFYGLIEARAAYAPASGESFSVSLQGFQG